jgi:hypothetical protein
MYKYFDSIPFPVEVKEIYYKHHNELDIAIMEYVKQNGLGMFSINDLPPFIFQEYLEKLILMGMQSKGILKQEQVKEKETVIQEYDFELLKENHDTNFGHDSVISIDKTNIDLPKRARILGKSVNTQGYQYGGYNEKVKTSLYEPAEIKYEIIRNRIEQQEIITLKDQKKYFNLQRYRFNKPRETIWFGLMNDRETFFNPDEPTISIGLFMDSNALLKKDFNHFTDKYFSKQIKLILTFKEKFPNGNVRVYFDKYLLDELEKMNGREELINLPQKVKKIESNDFDINYSNRMQLFFDSYMTEAKKLDSTNFKTGLHRFLAYYDLASCSRFYNNTYSRESHIGDFFVYELTGPFVQYFEKLQDGSFKETNNTNSIYKTHHTFGYIGQHMRYIALNQKEYIHNGYTTERPRHIIWRDGHTNSLGKNDGEIIAEFNKVCKNKSAEVYLMPTSTYYEKEWHDTLKCGKDIVFRSAIAGIVEMANFTNTASFIPEDVWKRTIGMPFIVMEKNNTSEIEILKERFVNYFDYQNKDLDKFMYGIDEYILTSIFSDKYFNTKTVYFTHYFLWNLHKAFMFNYENNHFALSPIYLSYSIFIFLFSQLYSSMNKQLGNISINDSVRMIEAMRNKNVMMNDKHINDIAVKLGLDVDTLANKLGILLSIYPSAYHIDNTLFNRQTADLITEKINSTYYYKGLAYYINLKYIQNKTEEAMKDAWEMLHYAPKQGEPRFNQNVYNEIINMDDKVVFDIYKDILQNLTTKYIRCGTGIISSTKEWCVRPYLFTENKLKAGTDMCDEDIYASGFYDVPLPKDAVLLRSPADLDPIITQLLSGKYNYDVRDMKIDETGLKQLGGDYYDKYRKYKQKYLALKK